MDGLLLIFEDLSRALITVNWSSDNLKIRMDTVCMMFWPLATLLIPITWTTRSMTWAAMFTAIVSDVLLDVWAYSLFNETLRKTLRFPEYHRGCTFTTINAVMVIIVTPRLLTNFALAGPLTQVAVGVAVAMASSAAMRFSPVTWWIARACSNADYATKFPSRRIRFDGCIRDALAIHVAYYVMFAVCGMQNQLYVRGCHALSTTFVAWPVLLCMWVAFCYVLQ